MDRNPAGIDALSRRPPQRLCSAVQRVKSCCGTSAKKPGGFSAWPGGYGGLVPHAVLVRALPALYKIVCDLARKHDPAQWQTGIAAKEKFDGSEGHSR